MRIVMVTLGLGLSAPGVSTFGGPPSANPQKAVGVFSQLGKAVWYGEQFHGLPTASGEPYDMFDLTAAHRDLPMGSLVRVTNLQNRRSVIVRINDRGPWGAPHRIIDVSYGASRRLGMVHSGTAPVHVEPISRHKATLAD